MNRHRRRALPAEIIMGLLALALGLLMALPAWVARPPVIDYLIGHWSPGTTVIVSTSTAGRR